MKKWMFPLFLASLSIPCLGFADMPDNNLTANIFGPKASRWYVGVGASAQWLLFDNKSNTLLTAPLDPANPDVFTLSDSTLLDGAFSALFGYQWIPKYGQYLNLFLEYDRFLSVSPNGTRYAYGLSSTSCATSSYSYALTAQTLFVGFKYDFLTWRNILPYGEVGLGISQTQFKNFYNNVAYSYGYSPVMNAFPDNNTYNPAGFIGFGIDTQLTDHWLWTVGYRFEYLGNINSGDVTSVPPPPEGSGLALSPIHLSNRLFSNALTTTMSYLFSS